MCPPRGEAIKPHGQATQSMAQHACCSSLRLIAMAWVHAGHRLQDAAGGGNTHDWTFYVRMDSAADEACYIDSVVVRLHPSFTPSTLTLTAPPFQVRRAGALP